MTKQTMEKSGQIMYESAIGSMTTGRRNSCSTLNRNSSYGGYSSHPHVESGYVNRAMAYDSGEYKSIDINADTFRHFSGIQATFGHYHF